jgi:hypothetical protein
MGPTTITPPPKRRSSSFTSNLFRQRTDGFEGDGFKQSGVGGELRRVIYIVLDILLTPAGHLETRQVAPGRAWQARGRTRRSFSVDEATYFWSRCRGPTQRCSKAMPRKLIDEYVLLIHPLVLGSGQRLFPDGGPLVALRLIDSKPTSTGVVIATYQPAPAAVAGAAG